MPRRRRWLLGVGFATLVAVLVAVLGARGGEERHLLRSTVSTTGTTTTTTTSVPAPTTTTTPVAGPPALPAPAGEQFGISVNRLFNDGTSTPRQIDSQLRAVRRTGATIARTDALWEAAEPAPPVGGVHHYDWGFADAIAGSLAAHQLRWWPIIDYTAPWAQSVPGQDHSPPRSASDYAAYAAAFAARYGRGGTFWRAHPNLPSTPVDTFEIWNEPDIPQFWVPTPDPGRFADLYIEARAAIKAVDPTARVIVGGLTAPGRFLPAMLSSRPDLSGRIDGVGIHPYAPTPQGVLRVVRDARAVLSSLAMATVPLYATEFGWTTQPVGALDWLPEQLRPAYLAATLADLGHLDCGVSAAFVYTWVTPERNPKDREDWFGIHPPQGGSTPATEAFTSGLRGARQRQPQIRLCAGG